MSGSQPVAYVTGAEGFLGCHVSRLLNSKGWQVIAIGHLALPADERSAWGIANAFHGEVSPRLLADAHAAHGAPDLLIHLAGTASVAHAEVAPFREFNRTVTSTAAVVEFVAARAPSAVVVYGSSAAIYGNRWNVPISVDAPALPISIYGTYKHLAEQLLLDLSRRSGTDCRIVRFFSLYGPGLRKQVIWDIANRILRGERELTLSGTGEETRDFLHVEDAAMALFLVSTRPDAPKIINAAAGAPLKIRAVVETIIASLGGGAGVSFSGVTRPGDPFSLIADISDLEALGFAPTWSFRRGVADVTEWIRKQHVAAVERSD